MRFWDGTVHAAQIDPRFTLCLSHPAALRVAFRPHSRLRVAICTCSARLPSQHSAETLLKSMASLRHRAIAKRVIAAVLGLVALTGVAPAGGTSLHARLLAANRLFLNHYDQIERSGGHNLAVDLAGRFNMDMAALEVKTLPAGYAMADYQARLNETITLDATLIRELLAGSEQSYAGKSGLFEGVIRAQADGTLQPYAVYIPPSYYHTSSPSIVVILHGQPQTESEILSSIYFRNLADASGSVLVAPYGRGLYDFPPPADEEVYQTLDHVNSIVHAASRRIYLAGYSMGGFSVYKVGPLHASRWAALMSIAGAILNSESQRVAFLFRNTPFYVVTGKQDQVIPSVYGEMSASFLDSAGIPTGFYEEPAGEHWLGTLLPSLTRAWTDMMAGTVHPPSRKVGGNLNAIPAAPKSVPMKP